MSLDDIVNLLSMNCGETVKTWEVRPRAIVFRRDEHWQCCEAMAMIRKGRVGTSVVAS
jgi:hypothetical protein